MYVYVYTQYIMGYLKLHCIHTIRTVIVIGDGQQMNTQVYSYAFHDQTHTSLHEPSELTRYAQYTPPISVSATCQPIYTTTPTENTVSWQD